VRKSHSDFTTAKFDTSGGKMQWEVLYTSYVAFFPETDPNLITRKQTEAQCEILCRTAGLDFSEDQTHEEVGRQSNYSDLGKTKVT
jgi:hypothetical protein